MHTKYRKFKQNKLYRDKLIQILESNGSKIHWTTLDDKEFSEQLKIKLTEETQEVCAAKTKDHLIEELADVLEVIDSLCQVHEFSMQDIFDAKNKKHDERGGFSGRKFITIAEHLPESLSEKYCLADPEKYPEIIED